MAGKDERSSSFVTLTNTQPGEAIDRSVRYISFTPTLIAVQLLLDIDLSERVGGMER